MTQDGVTMGEKEVTIKVTDFRKMDTPNAAEERPRKSKPLVFMSERYESY